LGPEGPGKPWYSNNGSRVLYAPLVYEKARGKAPQYLVYEKASGRALNTAVGLGI